jgi:hypothetical protein
MATQKTTPKADEKPVPEVVAGGQAFIILDASGNRVGNVYGTADDAASALGAAQLAGGVIVPIVVPEA